MKATWSILRAGTWFLLFSSLFATLSSCEDTAPVVDVPPPDLHEPYDALLAKLDATQPGFGAMDYPGGDPGHIVKSYAMVLISEIRRGYSEGIDTLTPHARGAANWILANADMDGDSIIGWGVPASWDAFSDGSINPTNTEYTISTGIAIEALLDWLEYDPSAPRTEILATVGAAIEPYLDSANLSPSGMLPYSLQASDVPYDCFNPAAFMAGELQRAQALFPQYQPRLQEVTDMTFQALIDHHKLDSTGHWYWSYSLSEDVSNDLPHASYIIHGICRYQRYGGTLSDQFDRELVAGHLKSFLAGDSIRGWFDRNDTYPRSYGLGMALEVAVTENLPVVRDQLRDWLLTYRTNQGFCKYPGDSIYVNEYQAYAMNGLSACLYGSAAPVYHALDAHDPYAHFFEENPIEGWQRVPLLGHNLDGHGPVETWINVNERKTFCVLAGDDTVRFDRFMMPLQWEETRQGPEVIAREIFTNKLYSADLTQVEAGDWQELTPASGIWDYRDAIYLDDTWYVVLFSSPDQKNSLFVQQKGAWSQQADLPSLEDPAGGTYEMIPEIMLDGKKSKLWMAGGRALWRYEVDNTGALSVPDSVEAILEMTAEDNGGYFLARMRPEVEQPYAAYRWEGESFTHLHSYPEAVYDLTISGGAVNVIQAKNPADQLRFEWERLRGQGAFYLGINNAEGRIPWDQIYYLNGMMDALDLVDRDADFAQAMAPLVDDLKLRAAIEVNLIAQQWNLPRAYTVNCFTVDRSPATFAVQTARILMLLLRARGTLGMEAAPHSIINALSDSVAHLTGHIDQAITGRETEEWIPADRPHLYWPKGCGFYYDGTPVPYNHQNEWAYAMYKAPHPQDDTAHLSLAKGITSHFFDHLLEGRRLPDSGTWDYWWGIAYDGWSEADSLSVNTTSYPGDHGQAWISFRTIDAMSSMAARDYYPSVVNRRYRDGLALLIRNGHVYPFASASFMGDDHVPALSEKVRLRYARMGASWEMRNFVWSLYNHHATLQALPTS